MFENYYHILGLDQKATPEEIKQAYRQLAKKYHPDKHKGDLKYEEKFKRILQAYTILSNPIKKEQFDGILEYRKNKSKIPFYSSPTTGRPNYAPPSYNYKREKTRYTPTVLMYGKLFIIGLISLVILIPIGLLYNASIIYYEEGLEYEENGEYTLATSSYKRAISFWSGRNVEATLRYVHIYLYKSPNYTEARRYIEPAFKFTNNDSIHSILHYYKGLSLYGNRSYREAMDEFKKADSLNYNKDSLELRMGQINTYEIFQFEEGIKNFDYLIKRGIYLSDSYFGKGFCYQNLGYYKRSIPYYDSALQLNPGLQIAVYQKGLSQLSIADTTSACQSFYSAAQKGSRQAESAYRNICLDSLNNPTFAP